MGSPEDPSSINAVIDEKAFDRIAAYIEYIKEQSDAKIIVGGGYDKSKGYIEPTVVLTSNPKFRTFVKKYLDLSLPFMFTSLKLKPL